MGPHLSRPFRFVACGLPCVPYRAERAGSAKAKSNSCQVVEDVVLQKVLARNLKGGPGHHAWVFETENQVYFVRQQQQQQRAY